MRVYSYNWIHIPTGNCGIRTALVHNVQHLHSLVNKWNGVYPHTFKYWTDHGRELGKELEPFAAVSRANATQKETP